MSILLRACIILTCLMIPIMYHFNDYKVPAERERSVVIDDPVDRLIIIDSLGREIPVEKPFQKIIALGNYRLEAVKVLGASEKVVGIDANSKKVSAYYFPDLQHLPDVGTWQEPNFELIASLNPDLIITSAHPERVSKLENKFRAFGITIVGLDFFRDDRIKEELDKLGLILDRKESAHQYIRWREKYEKMIGDYIAGVDEQKMPRVYMEWGQEAGRSWGKGSSGHAMSLFTGGNNIASEVPESAIVSMEWVLERNPEVIIKCVRMEKNQWGWTDIREPQMIVDEIKRRPGLALTDAVKNGRVYVYCSEIAWGLDSIVAAAYWIKWFHPKCKVEPVEIYREYLETFLKLHYPQHHILAYPPLRSTATDPDGLQK